MNADFSRSQTYDVAIVYWSNHSIEEIPAQLGNELKRLGHRPSFFRFDERLPVNVDVIFTFAPYGPFIQFPLQIARMPKPSRPIFVHWNMENPPDLRLPAAIVTAIANGRSWFGQQKYAANQFLSKICSTRGYELLNSKATKFRYFGDYMYASRNGLLDIYVESSTIYAEYYRKHGLAAECVPWGTMRSAYKTLGLRRDIDVLWFGKRRTKRRSQLLDHIRQGLRQRGIQMYVADNVENPFIFGDNRTDILNRAKITLNLLPTWYDHALPYRFHVAAPNRSLLVSETTLPHSPHYRDGEHYVSAKPEDLVDLVERCLDDHMARQTIVENAFDLCTAELTFEASVKSILVLINDMQRKREG